MKKPKKIQKKKQLSKLPKLVKGVPRGDETFPVKQLSPSSMILFACNPLMFKIGYINGDWFDSADNAAAVLGRAFHKALETYFGGNDEIIIDDESHALEMALKVGLGYLEAYPEGNIKFNDKIPTKQRMYEMLSFGINEYVKEIGWNEEDTLVATEEPIEKKISVEWKGTELNLPIPLKGVVDKVIRTKDGKLKIVDYKSKTVGFSDDEQLDPEKMLAAVVYYFLVWAEYGEQPYSMVYEEVKMTKNSAGKYKGKKQVRTYEMVYEENDIYFDFFFRMYFDIVRALNGEQVFLPNFNALYDKDVAIIAYINRLDMTEEQAKLMKRHRVDNITDLLKRRIAKAGDVRRFMKTAEKELTTAKTLNYQKMTTEDKIRNKMMEHGIILQYESVVHGPSVDRYLYTPSVGVKMKTLEQYSADIEQVLGVEDVRILAPVKGTTFVGFEVPRKDRQFLGAPAAARSLRIPIGVDVSGETQYIDLKTAPHVLVCGTTGSGKSSTVRSMLHSIGGSADLWLMDPKLVELNSIASKRYSDTIFGIMRMLKELTDEMDTRYKKMKESGEREWSGRSIVAVVDEYADLVMQSKEGFVEWELCEKHRKWDEAHNGELMRVLTTNRRLRVAEQALHDEIALGCNECVKHVFPPAAQSVVRLAQKGRAAGIHLIVATQRPSVDVITGIIKANFPTRIALRTASVKDSEVVIDTKGAEKLLGKSDMLLMRSDRGDLPRLQGYYVD